MARTHQKAKHRFAKLTTILFLFLSQILMMKPLGTQSAMEGAHMQSTVHMVAAYGKMDSEPILLEDMID